MLSRVLIQCKYGSCQEIRAKERKTLRGSLQDVCKHGCQSVALAITKQWLLLQGRVDTGSSRNAEEQAQESFYTKP